MKKIVLLALLCLITLVAISPEVFAVRYQVTYLGMPGTWSTALGINNNGQITGISGDRNGNHGFLWENGKMFDLGTLGGANSGAGGINDLGQIVGYSEIRNDDTIDSQAFLWQNGVMTQLSTLGGKLAGASDINNNGQIAGASEARGGAWHACLWQDGNVTDVHPAGVLSQANCINNAGDTAGYYRLDNFTCNAFIRQNGVTADLGSTGAEFTYTLANGINDNAQVVGCSATEDNSRMHAFLWQNGVMTDLGNLGMEHCWANSINNKGQIVGASYSIPGEMEHGCIWEDGVIIDLNDLVDPEGGWKIQYAQCINDIGQIVGVGYNDSSSGAVLLTPISEADRVKIDIKPGDPANSINLRSRGVVPVAVISTSEFDALAIDYASVVFAGAKPAKWGKVDVNSDGRVDMLFHFRTQELKLSVKCAEAKLTGKTTDGKLIDGIDSVKILK